MKKFFVSTLHFNKFLYYTPNYNLFLIFNNFYIRSYILDIILPFWILKLLKKHVVE